MSTMKADGKAPVRLFWLQSGGCGGCSLSLLGAEAPDLVTVLEAANIEVLWHPSLSVSSGAQVIDLMERISDGSEPLDILCLEGSVMRGPNGTGRFHIMAGTDRPVMDWVEALAKRPAMSSRSEAARPSAVSRQQVTTRSTLAALPMTGASRADCSERISAPRPDCR